MTVLDVFTLPSDVAVMPVSDLDPELRAQFEHGPGDYCVTRPLTRTVSVIVNASTARLLEHFRRPTRIVDAVVAFSIAEEVDARQTLDDAFEVLGGFVHQGLLLPADSALATPVATAHRPGDRVGQFEILAPVHLVVDTEVYRALGADGSTVALKISRNGAEPRMRHVIANEAAVLAHLNGRVSPAIYASGELDGRPYIATSWCDGVSAYEAAAQIRALPAPWRRAEITELCARLLDAYSNLHTQRVLHGDVHPRNIVVGADGAVTIIDFGSAMRIGAPPGPARAHIDLYLDPESALASLAGLPMPALDAAAEQYSVAAMLYFLVCGAHTHTFSLNREEMLGELAARPPLPMRQHGVADLPAVERCLRRALAKRPDARYSSVARAARSFNSAAAHDRAASPAGPRRSGAAARLLDDVVSRYAAPGPLFCAGLTAPSASAMNGAAGVAYALLRISRVRRSPELLAAADLWSARARMAVNAPEAFWNHDLGLIPQTIGHNSFFHHAAGVHCVAALVAHGRGDAVARRDAVAAFTAQARQPVDDIDVAFGRSGMLLGCALLLDTAGTAHERTALEALGGDLSDSILREIEAQPPIADGGRLTTLGAAHGWAGVLNALLRWHKASSSFGPASLGDRLSQLGALAVRRGRGLCWPYRTGTEPAATAMVANWCNGAAGYIPLWASAHAHSGEESFLNWAIGAAWTASEQLDGAPRHLCCGVSGRAYAVLALYRHTGDERWLGRAQLLADRAAEDGPAFLRRDSLFHGDIGVALLAAEFEDPQWARLPFIEDEGWG